MTDSTTSDAVNGPPCSLRYVSNCVQSRRRVLYGAGLALGGAVCWAGTVVCVRRSLRARPFYAPFFVTYFLTSFTLLVYPAYVVFRLVVTRANVSVHEIIRYALRLSVCLLFTHANNTKLPTTTSIYAQVTVTKQTAFRTEYKPSLTQIYTPIGYTWKKWQLYNSLFHLNLIIVCRHCWIRVL